MPFVQAKCPECGGMLAVDGSKKAAVCQFCGEPFVIEDTIINNNTYNTTNHNYGEGAVVNVYENKNPISALIERVFMFLEDGNFASANEYCEKVLDIEPENALAYLGKLMAELRVNKKEALKNCSQPFDDRLNYKKILRFGDAQLVNEIKGYIAFIKERIEAERLEQERKEAAELLAIKLKDEVERLERERRAEAESKRIAAEKLELQRQEEARLEKERQESEFKAKRNRKIAFLVVCAIVIVFLLDTVILPKAKFNNAMNKLEAKEYDSAYVLLEELGETEIIYSSKYDRATELLDAKDYEPALELFSQIFDYKDSAEIAKKIYFDKNPDLKTAKVGDYVSFGSYEQDNDTSNGYEEIEWLVLEKEDNKIFVISKYGLDCQPYNTEEVDFTTWDVCTLREWLDSDFALNAFTGIEQKLIPEVTISSESWNNSTISSVDGQKVKILGGVEIQAKVFLLEESEANKYFTSGEVRQCKATDYATAKGATVDDNMNCSWWLRSCTFIQNHTWTVSSEGEILGNSVYHESTVVRPAMWIEIN